MKNKIIDKSLYLEGLKQGRLIGILFTALLTLAGLIVPINEIMTHESYTDLYLSSYGGIEYSFLECNFGLVLCFGAIAPLLTLVLFNFTTKRNASDFYHSLPHTRTCVTISFAAAILTWVMVAIAVSSGLSSLAASLSPNMNLVLTNAPIYLFNIVSASFMVMASVMLAMSLTGNLFSNITVSLMIIFLPRLLILLMTNAISDATMVIADSLDTGLLSPLLNIPFAAVFGVFDIVNNASNVFENLQSGVYTLCLGVLYFIVSIILFNKRNSEAATKSAATEKLQSVIRVAISFAVCIIVVTTVFVENNLNAKEVRDYASVVILGYALAVLVYFAYELITTRKFSRLKKIFPGLIVLGVLNIVCYGAMQFLLNDIESFRPEPDEIVSIEIIEDDHYSSFTDQYFDEKVKNTVIEDDEVIEIISTNLKEMLDDTFFKETDYYCQMQVIINTEKKSEKRQVFVRTDDTAEIDVIHNAMLSIPSVQATYMNLPALGVDETKIIGCNIFKTADINPDIPTATLNDIYSTLREEVLYSDFNGWYNTLASVDDSDLTISIETTYENRYYSITLPITEFTPKAYNKMMQAIDDAVDKDELCDRIENIADNFYKDAETKDNVYFFMKHKNTLTYLSTKNPEDINLVLDYIMQFKNEPVREGDSYIQVLCSPMSEEEMKYGYAECAYFYIPNDEIPQEISELVS